MNPMPLPLTQDIVLVGGGHSHALVLRKWGMRPLPGARLTLINPGPTAPYSGMLPGHVAGHYARAALNIDLVRLARFAGARLILGAAVGIDRAAKLVHVPGRPAVGYDLCSVDIGITSDMPRLPGFGDHAVPAKPLGPFARAWAGYLASGGPADVAVIGAGVAGVELALAMAHALKASGRDSRVTLLDSATALTALRPVSARKIRERIAGLGIDLRENTGIEGLDADKIRLSDGTFVKAGFVTGAAGARPYGWLAECGLETEDGFVAVGPTLQSSDPAVFAVGDCAHMRFAPRPKAGVYAVRQAPVLFDNLRALASGRALRPYRPQDDYLKLISLGGKSALGEKFGMPVSGPAIWRWKDRIDQRFMDQFRDLPVMPQPDLPREHTLGMAQALGPKPLCGGCGAKIGRAGLAPVLATSPEQGADAESLPGDDAAVLTVGGERLAISTDHLRAFTEDPVIMTRIAAVHALGDIWAMGGQPRAATISLILPRLAADLQARTLNEIMAAARAEMRAGGAGIVGGHSSVGAELTIGFTVTGTVAERPITLGGGRPGDALILTKPLGSGVLMAGEMAGKARGDWVEQAFETMVQPQGKAAAILAGAHAMTDVTGFGLAGHLTGMCEASGLGAEIDVAAIPVMVGAVELSALGLHSSLYAENREVAPALPDAGKAALLFDPQTAGGLLAAVAAQEADELVDDLRACGYPAARIGRLVAGAPVVTAGG